MTPRFFPVVVAEMLRQGFTADEIAKVGGGSYCRVFWTGYVRACVIATRLRYTREHRTQFGINLQLRSYPAVRRGRRKIVALHACDVLSNQRPIDGSTKKLYSSSTSP